MKGGSLLTLASSFWLFRGNSKSVFELLTWNSLISTYYRNFVSPKKMAFKQKDGKSSIYSMAFITAPNQEVARNISKSLVSEKLAACVNIIPGIESVYEWEGKIEVDSEFLLMIKTRTDRIDDLTQLVIRNHPYDVVEVITSSIDGGNTPYLEWIGKVVPPQKPST